MVEPKPTSSPEIRRKVTTPGGSAAANSSATSNGSMPGTPNSSAGGTSMPARSPQSSHSSSNKGNSRRRNQETNDHLRIETDEEILSQFVKRKVCRTPQPVSKLLSFFFCVADMELVVMFSCKVKKWNKYLFK